MQRFQLTYNLTVNTVEMLENLLIYANHDRFWLFNRIYYLIIMP